MNSSVTKRPRWRARLVVALLVGLVAGWLSHYIPLRSEEEQQELPASALGLLAGQASLLGDRMLAQIYNKSDFTVSEVLVKVIVKQPDGTQGLNRTYRLTPSWPAAPLTSTAFGADLGFDVSPKQTWEWSITSAKGRPAK